MNDTTKYGLRQIVIGLGSAIGGFYGEHLQNLARDELINYSWYQGHASDFFYMLGLPTLMTFWMPHDETTIVPHVGIPLSLFIWKTSEELNRVSDNGAIDLQDIACYAAGGLLAFLLSRSLTMKDFARNTKKLVTDTFSTENLESMVIDGYYSPFY
tara:strand:- start:11931 stop:12398 length:468 start_codon:yes stop_codon:yes gene_type:complete